LHQGVSWWDERGPNSDAPSVYKVYGRVLVRHTITVRAPVSQIYHFGSNFTWAPVTR